MVALMVACWAAKLAVTWVEMLAVALAERSAAS
jgi:hypothetical protein